MLKKTLCQTLAIASFILPTAIVNSQSALAARQDFRVHNRARITLIGLHVSPAGNRNWGRDVLADKVIPSGGHTTVLFPQGVGGCVFDIKAVFRNGDYLEYYAVNLCQVSDVYFP